MVNKTLFCHCCCHLEMYILTWVVTVCRCLQCTSWHLDKSPSVFFIGNKNNRHFHSSVFSHTWSMQSRGLIFCCQKPSARIVKSFCLTYSVTKDLLSMFLTRKKILCLRTLLGFSSVLNSAALQGEFLIVSFSHASSWSRSYGWTDFLSCWTSDNVRNVQKDSKRQRSASRFRKTLCKNLELSFSRLQCMNTSELFLAAACRGYWRLPEVGGSHARDILVNSKTCRANVHVKFASAPKKKFGKLAENCTMVKSNDNFQHDVIEMKRCCDFIDKILTIC